MAPATSGRGAWSVPIASSAIRKAVLRVRGSAMILRRKCVDHHTDIPKNLESVQVDFENGFALVVPTTRADTVRNLVITTLGARVDGYALGLDMGAPLPLALLRRAFLWYGHRFTRSSNSGEHPI
jgi:hypothetical protein